MKDKESRVRAGKWFDPRHLSIPQAKAGRGIQAAAAFAFVGVLSTV